MEERFDSIIREINNYAFMPKILVILGATATGKSDLAVELALKFNGEIISADSRQVYKGLDIGTGKIIPEEMRGVKHYLLDIVEPFERFSVVDWQREAKGAINEILNKGKLPIICGGTGYYIESIVNNTIFPDIKGKNIDENNKTKEDLFNELFELDPKSANIIDKDNIRKLRRALELAQEYGKVPEIQNGKPVGQFILIGISFSDKELKERINIRLEKRIETGMIEEAKNLHDGNIFGQPLSYEKMEELGLEYKYMAKYLKGELTQTQFKTILATKIWQYARRQKTWWRRMKGIEWFTNPQVKVNMDAIIEHVNTKLYD
jgi:tRNA dimethylallyltransferase